MLFSLIYKGCFRNSFNSYKYKAFCTESVNVSGFYKGLRSKLVSYESELLNKKNLLNSSSSSIKKKFVLDLFKSRILDARCGDSFVKLFNSADSCLNNKKVSLDEQLNTVRFSIRKVDSIIKGSDSFSFVSNFKDVLPGSRTFTMSSSINVPRSLGLRVRNFRSYILERRKRFGSFYFKLILKSLDFGGFISKNNKSKLSLLTSYSKLDSLLNVFSYRGRYYPDVSTSSAFSEKSLLNKSLQESRWVRLHYSRLLSYFNKFQVKSESIGFFKKRFNFLYSKRNTFLVYSLKPSELFNDVAWSKTKKKSFLSVYRLAQSPKMLQLQSLERTSWLNYFQKFRIWFKVFKFLNSKRGYLNLWFSRSWAKYMAPCIVEGGSDLFNDKFFYSLDNINKLYNSGDIFSWRKAVMFRLVYLFLKGSNTSLEKFKNDFDVLKNLILNKLDNSILGTYDHISKVSNPLPYESLVYSRFNREKTLWSSRSFWNIKKHSVLFTKRRFQKRFHMFRVERLFRSKRQKQRKVKTLLEYSHSRFHKFRLFYTTLGYRQFQNIFKNVFNFKKNVVGHLISLLELRLEFFLYRVNFAPSKYFAKQLLKHRGVFINGISVIDKNHMLSVFDTVYFSDDKFWLVYNTLLSRLRVMNRQFVSSKGVLSKVPLVFSHPDYCEIDFSLLTATILRLPKPSDVFVPNHLELDTKNLNMHHIYNSYL